MPDLLAMPLETQARFLTAKYGTAAGPTGLRVEHLSAAPTLDLAGWMIVLGFLIFLTIVFILVRDAFAARQERTERDRLREKLSAY